ncbi:hypothetical protein, partial [Akkermansia sp.]|uniref:hypothetical protein n=1 Tax=Akkermansia sp. TaxID=1872421 RepID=UPI0025B9489A
EGRQKAHESHRENQHPAGSVHQGAENGGLIPAAHSPRPFLEKKAGKPGAVAKERQGGKNRLRNLRQGSSIPGCEEAPVMLSDRA